MSLIDRDIKARVEYQLKREQQIREHDLRDWFAGQALIFTVGQFWECKDGNTADHAASAAYNIADAMMKARGASHE